MQQIDEWRVRQRTVLFETLAFQGEEAPFFSQLLGFADQARLADARLGCNQNCLPPLCLSANKRGPDRLQLTSTTNENWANKRPINEHNDYSISCPALLVSPARFSRCDD